jgi:hypothetical protein
LIRSDRANNTTGFKGVYLHQGRYQAKCNTSPCRHNHHLGRFDTPEEAAQAYLQHYQKQHPEELEKERARPVLLPVQEHLLIRSDRKDNKTGYRGVRPSKGRYQATCKTPPCKNNHLGSFDTPEEGAQAYLQHYQKEHPEELKNERAPPLQVQEHLLIRSDTNKTGYKGVYPTGGRYHTQCHTTPCRNNHLGTFGTPEEAAQAYL